MQPVRLMLVGGFLGSGKTTLLARAGHVLAERGRRVGFIANDQAANLVDTAVLKQGAESVGADPRVGPALELSKDGPTRGSAPTSPRGGVPAVAEVWGGCFCCRFSDLLTACNRLIEAVQPEIILGEPVGSCTDISATVLQPLKQLHGDRFRLAPFSVLVDPARLGEAFGGGVPGGFPESVHYIFRKQLEEADAVVINKADTLSPIDLARARELLAEHAPGTAVHVLSALTGNGVEAWLDQVLADSPAGRHITDVNYDTYAEGEAVLGWLNAAVQLRAAGPIEWPVFAHRLLQAIADRCRRQSAEIAHLKVFLTAEDGTVEGHVTSSSSEPTIEVRGIQAPSARALLLVNARVHVGPEALTQIVQDGLADAAGAAVAVKVSRIESFRPGRPTPTHRFTQVVNPG